MSLIRESTSLAKIEEKQKKELKEMLKGFEANKTDKHGCILEEGDDESHSDDENLYLTPNGKFDVLNEYFGISALPLPPSAGNERKMKKAIKHLKKIGALISGDFDKLCHVIRILKSQKENKKPGKECPLAALLAEKVFFKKKYPMSKDDLALLCNYAKYEVFDSGQTVFKQGDLADKCYIILKG